MGKKTINIYLVFLAVFFVFVFFSLLYRVNISKWGYELSEFEWIFNRHLSLIVAYSLIFFYYGFYSSRLFDSEVYTIYIGICNVCSRYTSSFITI